MGKPPSQSDGPYISPNIDHEEDMARHGASPRATKWLYTVIIVMCVILGVLLMVALHMPSGEN
jgi:uncharacterized membrane protein